ncbi:MAG: class I adenylate-forming enzyme family protein [Thermodesulfobacteriota bacterium]
MEWRVIFNNEGEVADLMALPWAVAEVGAVGPQIHFQKTTPQTIIFQKVKRKGILAGAEVIIDREEAEKEGVEIAVLPKGGRGGMNPAETIPFQELILRQSDQFTSADSSVDEIGAIIYTSGTVGNPKGAMLTHGNFLSECEGTMDVIVTDEADRFASLVPFFHVYGLAIGVVVPLFRGCCTILIPQYSPRNFLKRMEEEKISILIAIPAQYFHLLRAGKRRPSKKSLLKYCISGAAPLPPPIIHGFKETFGVNIMEGYGLTETTSAVAVNPAHETRPGSVGLPIKGVKIKVVDEKGRPLPAHINGEILVKGKCVMAGYYNRQEGMEGCMVEGWFQTGDIGYQDEEGYLYITDRKKDLIIKGGFNISPVEIETLLNSHPKVREAAVVGEKEKGDREEAIKAFIVPAAGEKITPSEIIEFCRRRLASYKVPDAVEFRETLPRSATGKVLKKELREGYRDRRLIDKK